MMSNQFDKLSRLDFVTLCASLESEHLQLEPLSIKHAEILYAPFQASEIYEYFSGSPPVDIASLRARYSQLMNGRSASGKELWFNWAIRFKGADRYAGTVQATVHNDMITDIAYIIFPEYWRNGYATEACRALIQFLRANLGVTQLRAYLDTRNRPSIALLEKLGFAKTGLVENADTIRGLPSDEFIYTKQI